MQNVLNFIVTIAYIIIFCLIISDYIKRRRRNKIKEVSPDNIICTPLDLIRNQYFPKNIFTDSDLLINSYMTEVFNIFIKLSPSMISTLTKVERKMIGLKVFIENPTISEEFIRTEIENMDTILSELIKVSHSMIEKLEEQLINIDEYTTVNKSKIGKEAVQAYFNAVNILMDLTDNHSILNYEIHAKLATQYPDLIEPFRIISGKVTYLFFVNLITYSNRIDQNIFIIDQN